MLLALDVGNTNVTVGVFEGDTLRQNWRLRTVRDQTADEWGVLLRNLFSLAGMDLERIDGIIIASVVPPLNSRLAEMTVRYFGLHPFFVTSETKTGIRVLYDNPLDVGADRIVNAVAAFGKYGGPCVVVDLGTAITFDVVSAQAEYLGGIICPGIIISMQALFTRAARLTPTEFRQPEKLIGTNPIGSMQSGFFYGALGTIDGILQRLKFELGETTRCIATGGQAELIAEASQHLESVDRELTLEGLLHIWKINRTN